jgi:hypothetical protein
VEQELAYSLLQNKLHSCENKLVRKIFVPKKYEACEQFVTLHNKALYIVYVYTLYICMCVEREISSSSIVSLVK